MIPAVLSLLVNLLGNAVSLFDHQQSGERWTKSTQTTILFKNQNSLTVYRFFAISSGNGWLDGWRMIAGDDTLGDVEQLLGLGKA